MKPSTRRDASEENKLETQRRAFERTSVEDGSETSSRNRFDKRRAQSGSSYTSRTSETYTSRGEYSDSLSYTGTDTGSEYSNSDVVWSEIGPGAPFPETKEEREVRLLGKLNSAMTNNMKYWVVEEGLGEGKVKPVPTFAVDEANPFKSESKNATADTWLAPSDDDMSVGVNDGSLNGDSGDEIINALGDFESAHDLATPWNDRPKVIARKIVKHIVNRALREKFPPVPGFLESCFGCVAPEDAPRRRRSRRR
jgi:hypothetical protein|tara:strand:- start:7775 stop:8533 length:759 start_codon:yes stop_codon:yes gene_type:complete